MQDPQATPADLAFLLPEHSAINCCLPAVPADDSCWAGQVSLRHWVPLGIVLSARSERFVTE